jgi:hypothetical protein
VGFDFISFAIGGLRQTAALPSGDVVLPELRFIDCADEYFPVKNWRVKPQWKDY